MLLKSLIARCLSGRRRLIYLFAFDAGSCSRRGPGSGCVPFSGLAIILLIAVPWHVLATLRNPPYFSLSMHSGPGEYHGFLWFFFINEQLLRFLNLRYPRDYNTVPRVYFWLFHLLWLFPWSVYLPAVGEALVQARGSRRAHAAAGAVLDRLHAGVLHLLDDAGVLLDAVLSGDGAAAGLGHGWWTAIGSSAGTRVLTVVAALCGGGVHRDPGSGPQRADAGRHLQRAHLASGGVHASLGHMEDLTLQSFAYLRLPLLLAAIAFLIGAVGTFRARRRSGRFCAAALMMVLFFQAARMALVTFDPYLSSRPLAEAILQVARGQADRRPPLLHVFVGLLLYESAAADAERRRAEPVVWRVGAGRAQRVYRMTRNLRNSGRQPERYYLVTSHTQLARLEKTRGPRQAERRGVQRRESTCSPTHRLPDSTLPPEVARM